MAPWLKRLVLTAALLVMPLQGIGATVSFLICNDDGQPRPGDVRVGIDQGRYHDNAQQNDAGTTGDTAHHPCFHFTAFAPPVDAPRGAQPDFPVRANVPYPFRDLFVPDRPQRPPLA